MRPPEPPSGAPTPHADLPVSWGPNKHNHPHSATQHNTTSVMPRREQGRQHFSLQLHALMRHRDVVTCHALPHSNAHGHTHKQHLPHTPVRPVACQTPPCPVRVWRRVTARAQQRQPAACSGAGAPDRGGPVCVGGGGGLVVVEWC